MNLNFLNPLSWIGKTASTITQTLTQAKNVKAQAAAYATSKQADQSLQKLLGEQQVTLSSVQQLERTWKDELATTLTLLPLIILLMLSVVVVADGAIQLLKGDLSADDFVNNGLQLVMTYGAMFGSLPITIQVLIVVVVMVSIGARDLIPLVLGQKRRLVEKPLHELRVKLAKAHQQKELEEQDKPLHEVVEDTQHPVTAQASRYLMQTEGYFAKPTKDSEGILTLWHGLNLEQADDPKLAKLVLEYEIDKRRHQLQRYDFYNHLDTVRRAAVVRATYWLGVNGFIQGFPKCIEALRNHNWQVAHDEFMDSKMGRGEMNGDGGVDGMKRRCQIIAHTFLSGE